MTRKKNSWLSYVDIVFHIISIIDKNLHNELIESLKGIDSNKQFFFRKCVVIVYYEISIVYLFLCVGIFLFQTLVFVLVRLSFLASNFPFTLTNKLISYIM